MSGDEYSQFSKDRGADLLVDFLRATVSSPSGRGPGEPKKFTSKALGHCLRKLATIGRGLKLDEADLPGEAAGKRGKQAHMSKLRTPIERVTGLKWIVTTGERDDHQYLWQPPDGWSYILLFPTSPDI